MKAIDIRNLNFGYDGVNVFDDFNLHINRGSFITVLGRGGSGKSTLFDILSGKREYYGKIFVFGRSINYSLNKGYIGIVSPNPTFVKRKVIDEFKCTLRSIGKSGEGANLLINKAARKYRIFDLMEKNVGDLNLEETVLISFVNELFKCPKILLLDNVLGLLGGRVRFFLREINKIKKRGAVINFSNDTEECLYGDEIVILGSDVISGKKDDILDEDIFNNNGLELPFIISLSNRLKFYGLVSKKYYRFRELIDDLWE